MDLWSFHGGAQSPGIHPILLIDRNFFQLSEVWHQYFTYKYYCIQTEALSPTHFYLNTITIYRKRRGEEDQRLHDLQVANASTVILRLHWVVSSTKFQIQFRYCAHDQLQTLRGTMVFANCECNILSQWNKHIMKSSCNRQHKLWQQQPAQKGESQSQCYLPPKLVEVLIWVWKKLTIDLFFLLSAFEIELASDKWRSHSTSGRKDCCWVAKTHQPANYCCRQSLKAMCCWVYTKNNSTINLSVVM